MNPETMTLQFLDSLQTRRIELNAVMAVPACKIAMAILAAYSLAEAGQEQILQTCDTANILNIPQEIVVGILQQYKPESLTSLKNPEELWGCLDFIVEGISQTVDINQDSDLYKTLELRLQQVITQLHIALISLLEKIAKLPKDHTIGSSPTWLQAYAVFYVLSSMVIKFQSGYNSALLDIFKARLSDTVIRRKPEDVPALLQAAQSFYFSGNLSIQQIKALTRMAFDAEIQLLQAAEQILLSEEAKDFYLDAENRHFNTAIQLIVGVHTTLESLSEQIPIDRNLSSDPEARKILIQMCAAMANQLSATKLPELIKIDKHIKVLYNTIASLDSRQIPTDQAKNNITATLLTLLKHQLIYLRSVLTKYYLSHHFVTAYKSHLESILPVRDIE